MLPVARAAVNRSKVHAVAGEIQEGKRGLSVCGGLLQEGRRAPRCNKNYELRMRTARCGERMAHGERSRGRKGHGSGSSVEVEVLWKWKFEGKRSLMETEVDGPFGPP